MTLRIVFAQLNFCVGDIEGNAAKMIQAIRLAQENHHAHLIVFSELALTGYPPEDLLYRSDLYDRVQNALNTLCAEAIGIDIVLGYPALEGKNAYNRAGWIHNGKLASHCDKQNLPNYSVFDEARYFKPGAPKPCVISIQGVPLAVLICEDIWYPEPILRAKAAGAEMVLVMNASPFSIHKDHIRQQQIRQRIQETGLPIAYLNCVGGQDELVFDGGSMVWNGAGHLVHQAEFFKEAEMVVEVGETKGAVIASAPSLRVAVLQRGNPEGLAVKVVIPPSPQPSPPMGRGGPPLASEERIAQISPEGHLSLDEESVTARGIAQIRPEGPLSPPWERDRVRGIFTPEQETARVYSALVLGLRDYIQKNNFKSALLGLSGGIDSALTLAIATDAIGKDRVQAIMMPSRYTSELSLTGARAQAERLGVQYHELSIEPIFQSFLTTLNPLFKDLPQDITEENLQARCRGTLLMAISNKQNAIVLATGNKSEMAVGYSTLYGDMVGGFCVLKDVFKTTVYKLAAYRNTLSENIPEDVINRPPSAELAPGQKDVDSLPPYPILDAILEKYIEEDQGVQEIVSAGFDKATVHKVMQMVDRSEYKRRQAPIGIRITERAFGKDRRYPITSGFKPGSKVPINL